MLITKAIIPAGGLGTRFLPATKAIPKEMLPILDKPSIQYVVEEGIKAGIKNYIMVTGKNKTVIEDHFDAHQELDFFLKSKGKQSLLDGVSSIMQNANFIYVRQQEPLGLGHAVWTARHSIGKEYVAVLLPDDIFTGVSVIAQLAQVAAQEKCSVIAVQEVPSHELSRYGVIDIRKQFSPNLFQIKDVVEKPNEADAPSNLAIVGRYILSPTIFEILDEQQVGVGGEIQLTDAIQKLLQSREKVFAYKIQAERYDTGTPFGLLKASIDTALRSGQYGDAMLAYLRKLDKDYVMMKGKAETLAHL